MNNLHFVAFEDIRAGDLVEVDAKTGKLRRKKGELSPEQLTEEVLRLAQGHEQELEQLRQTIDPTQRTH